VKKKDVREKKKEEKEGTTEVVKQAAKEVTKGLYGKLQGNKPLTRRS